MLGSQLSVLLTLCMLYAAVPELALTDMTIVPDLDTLQT